MRRVLTISFLVLTLLIYGCGGDTVVSGGSAPNAPVGPTGNILVKFDLEQPRLVPLVVTSFRFIGFAVDGPVVFGPKTFPKASEVLLEDVPVSTVRLSIELLAGEQIVGIASVAVTVTEGGTFVIESVDFSPVTPDALAIEPTPLVLSLGEQRTLRVISGPHDPAPVDVTDRATLASSNPAVLRVDGPGQVTALSVGTASLTATFEGESVISEVTVSDATVIRVELTPKTSKIMGQLQFRLIGTFSDGVTTDLTTAGEWSSSAPSVLTVGNDDLTKGLARTVTLGSAEVTVKYKGMTATQAVTTVGGARLLSANATNSNGGNDESSLGNGLPRGKTSRDGRLVVFSSEATNLLPAGSPAVDTNRPNIYLRDLRTNTNTLLSVDVTGTKNADARSDRPVITPDGRFVFFNSRAKDLVATDPGAGQIYRRDLATGKTEVVSLNGDATPKPANADVDGEPIVSADGRILLFEASADNFPVSGSSNMRKLIWRNLVTGEVQVVNLDASGTLVEQAGGATMSQDGRFVGITAVGPTTLQFPLGQFSILVRDTQLRTSRLVSVDQNGRPVPQALLPILNPDGTQFFFFCQASADFAAGTYHKDLTTGALTYRSPVLALDASEDGRFLVGTLGEFLGIGLPVLTDLETGAITRVDVTTDGKSSSIGSFGLFPGISPDGSTVLFGAGAGLDPIVTETFSQVFFLLNPYLP